MDGRTSRRARSGGGDLEQQDTRLGYPQSAPTIFPGNRDAQPTGVGELMKEFVGVLTGLVFAPPIVPIELTSQITHLGADQRLLLTQPKIHHCSPSACAT